MAIGSEPLCWWSPLVVLDDALVKAIPAARRRSLPNDTSFAGYVGGWLSLGTKDRQDEVIDPEGLDVSMFIGDGWFNDNHSRETAAAVGYPVIAELREHPEHGQAWWTEGPVLDTSRGREIMELARSLAGNPDRQLGFSVQGPPPLRDPTDKKHIVKAWVWDAAITNRPVHADARMMLVKSMTALNLDAGVSDALAELADRHPQAARALWKTLTAGSPEPNAATGATALQRESVDGVVANATFDGDGSDAKPKRRRRKRRKALSYEEAAGELVKAFPVLSRDAALAALARMTSVRVP